MQSEWLSLSDAAQILGVHPSTVRSWSDQGILPVHRTNGGHRRYWRGEIELWVQSQQANGLDEINLMVQNALRNVRFHISEGILTREAWYNKLDDEARELYRASGRNLMQGLINSINSSDDNVMDEAEALGYEYASRGRRYGMNSVEAANAFLFFRNSLLESMLKMYEAAAVRSPHAWSNMFRRINEFTDRILITILETYEAYTRATRG
ncbi:MAG: helix-turn-helix domain-containing protein [Anaerolineales bacterium]|nr:helix-turn-helix domain-containing protein [Anaerolineales bacterium]